MIYYVVALVLPVVSLVVAVGGRWSFVVAFCCLLALAQNTPSMYLHLLRCICNENSRIFTDFTLGVGDTTKGMVVEQNRYKKVSCKKCTNGG